MAATQRWTRNGCSLTRLIFFFSSCKEKMDQKRMQLYNPTDNNYSSQTAKKKVLGKRNFVRLSKKICHAEERHSAL